MMLTKEQQLIVDADHPFIVVNAVAGAGKSHVLVERVKRLVAGGVDPKKLVCITFTKAAAKELAERLHPLEISYCGTIHGFALSLLRKFGSIIGFSDPQNITVLNESTVDQMVDDLMEDSGYKGSQKALMAHIKECRTGTASHTLSKPAIMAVQFNRQLFAANSVTYDSLLAHMERLAPMLVGLINYQHILIDEVQDLCDADASIIEHLPIPNRLVVGDDFQAIMNFRGGTADHLQGWATSADCQLFKLEHNFRSDILICEAAARLISHNVEQLPKQIIPVSTSPGRIELHFCTSESAEIQLIASTFNQCGYPADKCAVLVRTNALCEKFKLALQSHGIQVKTRQSLPWPKDWARCSLMLALVVDPENEQLAYQWLRLTHGKTQADKSKAAAMRAMSSLRDAGFVPVISQITQLDQLLSFLRVQNIGTPSINLVAEIWTTANCTSVRSLLDAISEIRELESEEGAGVAVSTYHRSKGLEYRMVALAAFEEGHMPGNNEEEIEEFRRLAFVGFTRAKNFLLITHCSTRENPWTHQMEDQQPSRFIAEAFGEQSNNQTV